MSRSWKIILIIALQIILLTTMIGSKYYTLHFGEPILLKTAPVDPWDMLRGEYVRLNYEISRVSGNIKRDFKTGADINNQSPAYVTLEKKEKYWSVTGIYRERPEAKDGQIIIKASTVYYDSYNNEYQIIYGIESYYVEEGVGKKLEQLNNLEVVVRVDRFGSTAIEKVISGN